MELEIPVISPNLRSNIQLVEMINVGIVPPFSIPNLQLMRNEKSPSKPLRTLNRGQCLIQQDIWPICWAELENDLFQTFMDQITWYSTKVKSLELIIMIISKPLFIYLS